MLKREQDRAALIAAATSDDARFFLGTDSAPHAKHTKEHACGCAGIFSAHAAIELYAEAFERAGRLAQLQAFASERGRTSMDCRETRRQITLEAQRLDRAGGLPLRQGRARAVPRGRDDDVALAAEIRVLQRRAQVERQAADG